MIIEALGLNVLNSLYSKKQKKILPIQDYFCSVVVVDVGSIYALNLMVLGGLFCANPRHNGIVLRARGTMKILRENQVG